MADTEHVRILSTGVGDWNQWRARNSDVQVDLRGADLRDAELPGVDLRNALLANCDFRDAVLDGADLSSAMMNSANLTDAQLRRAVLIGVDAQSATLQGADATDANLSEANFQRATLSGATLVDANLNDANFKDANLTACDLRGANLSRTDFRDASMQQAILIGASIQNGDFRRCRLDGANFSSARLTYARFRHAALNTVNLNAARVANADFRQAKALSCEQLTQAIDWRAAYRDADLACGAEVPGPIEGVVAGADAIDQIFATSSSRWRDDVDEDVRAAQLVRSREALESLAETLNDLNAELPEQLGHNNPPEPIITGDLVSQLLAEVRAGIDLHEAPRPDKSRLSRLGQSLYRFRKWLQPRIDRAADGAATVVGAGIVTTLTALLAKLTGAWEQIQLLVEMLM